MRWSFGCRALLAFLLLASGTFVEAQSFSVDPPASPSGTRQLCRLPAVDNIDWQKEAEALLEGHVPKDQFTAASLYAAQPTDSNRASQSGASYYSSPSAGNPGTRGYGATIGTGPSWLGEMAPYVLTGDREGVGFKGILEACGIYDTNGVGLVPNQGVQRVFQTSLIPVTGTQSAQRYPRSTISPNQTSLGVWFEQPTDLARFRAYALMNLFKSPSYDQHPHFQVYKVYANYGWFKVGHDYSVFFNQAAAPDCIDFEGPNAIPYCRFAQLQLNIPLVEFGGGLHEGLVLGFEHAPGSLTLLDSSIPQMHDEQWGAVDFVPSCIAKWVYTPEWAHIELAGLFRRLAAGGPGYSSSAYGYGMALSGKIATWGQNNLIVAGQAGKGIGEYAQDAAGMGLDAAPKFVTPSGVPGRPILGPLRAIPLFGAWIAYQHFWTETLRSTGTFSVLSLKDAWIPSNLTASVNRDESSNSTLYGRLKQARYTSVNLVWSPNPTFTVGMEYLYGHRYITGNTTPPDATSDKGQANRFQLMVQWNYDHTTRFNK